MRIIGVTGGIGSGKSTVTGILAGLGASVVDADKISREVTAKGGKALGELAAYFGEMILDSDGELDRKRLAQIVFGNSEKLEFLNRVTHKYIAERMIEEVENLKCAKTSQFIVLDVPIPVEHGFLDTVDTVWVVVADEEIKIDRIMNRSGFTRQEAISRMASQRKDDEYIRIADETIVNNEGIEQLKEKVMFLYSKYL